MNKTNSELDSCSKKNNDLYQTNAELIDAYNKEGIFDALMEREPFTGLKKVATENATQERKEQIDQAHYVVNN